MGKSDDHHGDFFAQLVRTVYGLAPRRLEPLPESDPASGAAAWRLDGDDGPIAILRAYRKGYEPPDHFRYFYPWACPDAGCEIGAWLASRAATLLSLEAARYPAAHVLRTRAGDAVGAWGGWHVLATGYVAGNGLQPTGNQLTRLGEVVGRLHALPLDVAHPTRPGPSYWAPQHAIPSARARLAAVAGLVPEEWQSLYQGMCETVEGIGRRVEPHVEPHVERGELAQTLIHGDVWAANAIQAPTGAVSLIDWDQGGVALAVLDLARLLLECHLDADLPPDQPVAWHIQPDPSRIAAVVDGYAQSRMPTPAELDALLDAMRFGVAFIGALHFEQALLRPRDDPAWREGMQRRYERLHNRFEVSPAVAELARARFRERLGAE